MPGDDTYRENIFDFTWPGGCGSAEGIRFWGALFEPGTYNLIGDIDMVEFGFSEGDKTAPGGKNKTSGGKNGLIEAIRKSMTEGKCSKPAGGGERKKNIIAAFEKITPRKK